MTALDLFAEPQRSWLDDNREWLLRARDRWAPRHVEPLTLRMWLGAPLAWDGYDGIRIEGALQSAVVVHETGRMPDDVFHGCPRDLGAENGDIQIPIADEVHHGFRIACASWAQPSPGAIETARFRRKRARIDAMPGNGKLLISGGSFKSMSQPIPTVTALHVDFHVRADRERLTELLSIDAMVLGRWRSAGLGHVIGTEILDDPEDRSLTHRGVPMRAIPVKDAKDAERFSPSYDLRPTTTRAPYWHARSRTLCVVPMVRVGES